MKVRARESTDRVVGAVTGPVSAPDTLLLGRWDAEARFRMIARTTPLSATARWEVGAVLTAAGDDHPWHGVTFSAGWGTRMPLPHVPVEPALVAEVAADTSVNDAGRYRQPVKFLRLRDDIGPDSVAPLPLTGTGRWLRYGFVGRGLGVEGLRARRLAGVQEFGHAGGVWVLLEAGA
ncbi:MULTISPECIES: hypothetical protein [Streptomyces]|uniref:Putative ATP-dependint DNA ligase n=1 Tax=Streptomyces griseus TaxID=1911 RepID=A0A380P7A3_STRGR|nr:MULTISPECIES: hypothetical protein [Streptomyces]NEE54707.1 hypothetical protein [Streptomyces sp. SID8455]RPK88550.1 ATP-dependent DNA ligase [Streptomyces sp. ADI98-12]SUP60767.1 putative ATP-dependint DNA ligase [Streptomyces griseus]